MKRLLITATVVLAFGATPAMAAPIPHGDDDPGNWGAVYNLDLCGGQPCEFSATSNDMVMTAIVNGEPLHIPPCTSVTMFYNLPPGGTVFDVFDSDWEGVCPFTGGEQTLTGCVYSLSGFSNGSSDIELWLRAPNNSAQPQNGVFAQAGGDAVGNYVYRFGSYEFDQQSVSTPATTATLDGTYDVDGDPVLVEHDRGATACGYPELS